jgi:hypothetical protein
MSAGVPPAPTLTSRTGAGMGAGGTPALRPTR